MSTVLHLIRRNLKLFFKDKGLFLSSMITPIILLVLYVVFLDDMYRDSFSSAVPEGLAISEKLMDSTVVCQLISSLLSVCCVTVSFCSNLLMINDKANKTILDLTVSPVRSASLAVGYYAASFVSTLMVSLTALAAGLLYLSTKGWYLTFEDVLLTAGDVVLLTLYGTALACCVDFFLSTHGQASAVGTVISAGYGFLCGAYMPISNYSEGLREALMFLPGTYGTSMIRNHMMRGVLAEMEDSGFPSAVMTGIRDSIDCNLYFNENRVSVVMMTAVLTGGIAVLTGLYILFNIFERKSA